MLLGARVGALGGQITLQLDFNGCGRVIEAEIFCSILIFVQITFPLVLRAVSQPKPQEVFACHKVRINYVFYFD